MTKANTIVTIVAKRATVYTTYSYPLQFSCSAHLLNLIAAITRLYKAKAITSNELTRIGEDRWIYIM